ncbi:hypothetical protein V6N13_138008 [Hibiscus sabdariffa]
MTSTESTMAISSTQDDDIDVWFDHGDDHQPHPHNLSMSTSSIYSSNDDDNDNDMGMYMSRLSIESFEADADEEFSGEELLQLSSDSDKKPCYYSLPAKPTHRRSRTGVLSKRLKEIRSDRKKNDGVVVITRPRGGRRSMCMDMEEVKACRDLGFELEMPLSTPFSSLDNASSGGNSPISNWLISGPGDDPRDVKARLKVWAQAVARASTSMHCS